MKKLFLLSLAVGWVFGGTLMRAADTNSTPDRIEGKLDVGGRVLRFESRGEGGPAVIVEAGLGEPVIESGTWKAVIEGIARSNRICIYDRAGLGGSEAVTNRVRTSVEIAQDLHALLVQAQVPPPYILVGHSMGGFHVRVFASLYADEVAGMVLVDSSHPDQWAKWLAALPPEGLGEPESIKGARRFLTSQASDPAMNPERLDIGASAAQVREAQSLGDMPLVVLSHSSNWRIDPKLANEVAREMERVSRELQVDLCRLSSNSTHQVAATAGHYIQLDDPQLVIEAIRKVRDAAKERRRVQ